jgi:hypothetical protein
MRFDLYLASPDEEVRAIDRSNAAMYAIDLVPIQQFSQEESDD